MRRARERPPPRSTSGATGTSSLISSRSPATYFRIKEIPKTSPATNPPPGELCPEKRRKREKKERERKEREEKERERKERGQKTGKAKRRRMKKKRKYRIIIRSS